MNLATGSYKVQNKLDGAKLLYEGSVKKCGNWINVPIVCGLNIRMITRFLTGARCRILSLTKEERLPLWVRSFLKGWQTVGSGKIFPSSPYLKSISRRWLDARWQNPVYQQLLCKIGCPSHYQALVRGSGQTVSIKDAAHIAETVYLSVLPAGVVRPLKVTILNQNVYHYLSQNAASLLTLVPLEVVFRFGMPAGSSLKDKLDKDANYAKVLGLPALPAEGQQFDYPVVELFTKLEDKDRLLSVQEALLISQLPPDKFNQLIELSYNLALALYVIFAEGGIQLWDGKFEFAIDEDKLLLVDSIGPDELRLTYKNVHLSKEMIRQVYRGSSWERALKEAQKLAAFAGQADWKEICRLQLKEEPKPLPQSFKAVVDKLYGVLTNHIVGQELFDKQPTLDEFVSVNGGGYRGRFSGIGKNNDVSRPLVKYCRRRRRWP